MATRTEEKRRSRTQILADISGAVIASIAGRNIRLVCGRIERGRIEEHSHEELQIAVLFEPVSCMVEAQGCSPVAACGPTVVMIAPRLPHACVCEEAGDAILLYVDRRLHQRLLPDGVTAMHVAAPASAQDLLLWQFAAMLRQLHAAQNPCEVALLHLVAESVATRAIDVIGREQIAPTRSLTATLLQKVEEFVRAQLAYDIHVDDLAKCVGYSVPHFSSLFKAAKGITPADYLFRCRMQRADELLRTGEHLIGEVAKLVGYLDQGHFTSLFREFFGYAPRTVLQQVRLESLNRPKIS